MRVLKEARQYLSDYHLKSGVFHFYRGEYGPAAEHLTHALRDSDRLSRSERRTTLYYLVQTRIGAARELEEKGEPERAVEQYRAALEVIPTYADVHARLGALLARLGREDEAIVAFEKALRINPDYEDALVRLGFVRLSRGEFPQAKEAFARAIAVRERRTRERLEQAERALEEGDVELARDLYKDTFRHGLDRFRDLFERALEQLRCEKWEEAVELLEDAVDLCPRFADVHNYLGVALAESGQLARAREHLERSVSINPDYVVAWLNLAYTVWIMEDHEAARTALDEVLRREPDNPSALHLARLLEEPAATPRAGGRPREGEP